MSRLIQSQLIYLILIMFYLIQGYRIMIGVEVPDSCVSVADSAPKHPSLRWTSCTGWTFLVSLTPM